MDPATPLLDGPAALGDEEVVGLRADQRVEHVGDPVGGVSTAGAGQAEEPGAQLKQFLDDTSSAWDAGLLAGKPGTGFTSSHERHGGQETALLALYQTLFHWGSVILPTTALQQAS